MKNRSTIFDAIRVKPDRDRLLRDLHPSCDWAGCDGPAMYKAPRGRGREGQFHRFCIDHVRIYNKAYNYFDGMSDTDVIDYQKSALTGHRPTWKWASNSRAPGRRDGPARRRDPFDFFAAGGAARPARTVRNAERRALTTLCLDETATPREVKDQYKLLVKRHHPDANGGRRESEEKLRDIIQAYAYLKSSGFC